MGKRRESGGGAASSARAVIDYRKLSAMILLAVVFYNEYYAYYSAYASWPYEEGEKGGTNILLVADPQLQGLRDERHFGSVTRWDADRYLRKTFSWAVSSYSVDAVVFLGDLLDEGSRTSDGEIYDDYVSRFKSIYPADSAKVMVHLDGDNDVGGEGEPVTKENVRRFREHFGYKPGLNPVGKVDIVVLDVLTMNASEILNLEPPRAERYRVGVSHVPVIPLAAGYSQFSKAALEHVKPDVVFSAHHHIGFDQAYSRHTGKSVYQGTRFSKGSSMPVTTNLTHDRESGIVHEIVVPTCSYRMGVPEMAFGLATFKFNGGGTMVYHNLWLPSRFGNLILYAAAVAVCSVLCCVGGIRSRRRYRRLSARRSSGPDPYSKLI